VGVTLTLAAAFRVGGVHRVARYPGLIGAFIAALGVSLATRSTTGLWVVTPTLALGMTAWVLGHLRHARGVSVDPRPFLSLPPDVDDPAQMSERFAFVLVVLAPWLSGFMAIELLGAGPDVRSTFMTWDAALPVIPWTESIYFSTYVLSTLSPFVVRTKHELRQLALDALWATLIILPLYLALPLVAEAKPVAGDGFWVWMLKFERAGDAPATAFPSFHIVWACIAATTWARRFPAFRWPLAVLVVLTGVACVTTGMHSAADIIAGAVAYGVVMNRESIWRALSRISLGASPSVILGALLVVSLTWRLWSVNAPPSFVAGGFLILASAGLFVATAGGGALRVTQRIAIALFLIGAVITTIPANA
jgi:hypothetical protein